MDRKALTYQDAADALSISLSSLKRLVVEGKIQPVSLGGHTRLVRIPIEEIERVLNTPPESPKPRPAPRPRTGREAAELIRARGRKAGSAA